MFQRKIVFQQTVSSYMTSTNAHGVCFVMSERNSIESLTLDGNILTAVVDSEGYSSDTVYADNRNWSWTEETIKFPLDELYNPPEVETIQEYPGIRSACSVVTLRKSGSDMVTVSRTLYRHDHTQQTFYNDSEITDLGDMSDRDVFTWMRNHDSVNIEAKGRNFYINDADWANRFAKAIARLIQLHGGKSEDIFNN
jgi:hypothetical protein